MNIKDYSKGNKNRKVLHNNSFLEPKKISAPNNMKQIPASSFDNGKRDFIKKGLLGLGIGAGAALLSQIPFANAVQYIKPSAGTGINKFSTDGTLAGNSDLAIPTEKAVKTYVDGNTGAGKDTTAIHDNVVAEISVITEKTTPVDADLLVIEDSAASNAKKRLQIGNLPNAITTAEHNRLKDNILMNAFRIAINGSLVKYNMVDGIMDEFEDESGVDTGTSTDESYDSANDLYSPASDYGSNVLTGGSASASADDLGYTADRAFDGDTGTFWYSGSVGGVGWLKYDLGAAITKILTKYSISIYGSPTQGPTAFTFQGSNNDSDWTTLDTQSGLSWSSPEIKSFTFSNTTAYRYYRLNITASLEGVNIRVYELEGMESTTENMTLVSNSTEAEANPDNIRMFIAQKDVDAVTLNTDIKGYASRDNGANWVQATLTEEVTIDASVRILAGTADVSGQASDKTVKWKVECLNNKDQQVKGVGYTHD